MESRMDYNHPSVCRFRHARFHVFIICFYMTTLNLALVIIIQVCDVLVMLDFIWL